MPSFLIPGIALFPITEHTGQLAIDRKKRRASRIPA
jgi:hypothetical protein